MIFAVGQMTPLPELRRTPLVEVWPQGKAERHAGIGCELVATLDAPVLQMVDQLVDVLQSFATFPVVAEQVIEVPKIILLDYIPQRAVLRVPRLAKQLVEGDSARYLDADGLRRPASSSGVHSSPSGTPRREHRQPRAV